MRLKTFTALLLLSCRPIQNEPAPDRRIDMPIAIGLGDDEVFVATSDAKLHEEAAVARTIRVYSASLSNLTAWRLRGEQAFDLVLAEEVPPSIDATFIPGQGAALAGFFTSINAWGVIAGELPFTATPLGTYQPYSWWGFPTVGAAVTVAAGSPLLWPAAGVIYPDDPMGAADLESSVFKLQKEIPIRLASASAVTCEGARCTLLALAGKQIVWSGLDATAEAAMPTAITFASLPAWAGDTSNGSYVGFCGYSQCKTRAGDKFVVYDRLFALDATLASRPVHFLAEVPVDGTFYCSAVHPTNQALWRFGDGHMAALDLENDEVSDLTANIPPIHEGYSWRDVNAAMRVLPLPSGGWLIAAGEATHTVEVSQCDYYPAFERCPVPYHSIATKIWILDEHGNEKSTVRLAP